MDKKNIFLTIVISFAAFTIQYLISFFLTPFITDSIGTEANGYILLAKNIAAYATIATTALNSYSARYITISYHQRNYEKAKEYFNSVLFTNILISIVLILFGSIFSGFAGSILKISDEILSDVKYLFILVFLNLALNLTCTAFQAGAYIKNKLHIISFFKGLSYLCEGLTLIALYSCLPSKIYYTGVGLIVASTILFTTYYLIYKKYIPEINISIRYFRKESVKELVVNGTWNSLNQLGNTLNSGLDLIVSNLLLSAVAMGQVSIVKTFVSLFNSIYQMVAQPFQPGFLRDYAQNEKDKLIENLNFSIKVSGFISNLAFAGIVAFGYEYYKLWVPNQDCILLYKLTIIAVATSIFEGAIYPLYYIYTLTVKNKIPCIITIVGGLLNVAGMFFLIKYTDLGIYAVFITTAVIMLFINGVTNPIYMARCLNIPTISFYPALVKHVVSCAVMTLALKALSSVIVVNSWLMLIVSVLVSCIIALPLHTIIVFKPSEIKSLINMTKEKLLR